MKAILIDDEISARRRLARLLSAHADVEITGEACDGLEGLELIEAVRPDVVFLDIQMPELDGFAMIRALPETVPLPLVIFATSYDHHALAAFEANAVAYLLKPIEAERLATALTRARCLLASKPERDAADQLTRAVSQSVKRLQRIVCRKGNNLLLVEPPEVLWFYIDGGIVRARTASETFWVNYQLNQLEAALDPEMFFRARREVLLNLKRVKRVRNCERSTFIVTMSDGAETEHVVSERHAKELRQRLPGL